MRTYFDYVQRIEMSEFLAKYEAHINERETADDFEKDTVYPGLITKASHLVCYLARLNEKGTYNLILPHHQAHADGLGNPDRAVQPEGEPFHYVVCKYLSNYIPNSRFPACLKKVQDRQSRFFEKDDPVFRADFLFVCNDKEIAHPGHYLGDHGEHKIYMGNGFHRFVAYGLQLQVLQKDFRPLELY